MSAEEVWQALGRHRDGIARAHLRQLFADDPGRAERFSLRGGRPLPRLLEAAHRRRDPGAAAASWRGRATCARFIDGMFAGETLNTTERRAVLHVALRAPAGRSHPGRRPRRRARGARDARAHAHVRAADRHGGLEGVHGETHPQRREPRHRRLGPRPAHGRARARALRRARDAGAFRRQCRPGGLRHGDRGPRPGRDALHRLLEDLHHAGDARQRARGARVVRECAGRRCGGGRAPLRGGLDEPLGVSRSSASIRSTPSRCGTGSAGATRSTPRSGSR